jgi:CubicO group peptidase (beta-lactamase class C family)
MTTRAVSPVPGRLAWVIQHLLTVVLAVWPGLLASQVALAQEAGDAAARVDALLGSYNRLGRFNGAALVARHGKVLLTKGYGMASFELSVPNRPDTKQWIGSVSKVFTAAMVMRLQDQGRLSLDARLADLLPWYRKDTGSKVTIRQLLSHTSGIPDYMHLPGIGREGFRQAVGDDIIDVKTFAQKWCSGDLAWEPGSRWGYSNSGYVLLGAVIEAVTGEPFARALDELVLKPAGLLRTADLAMHPRSVVEGLACGYEKQAGNLLTRRPWNVSTAYAAGSMVSTVEDLFAFDQALKRDDFVSPRAREAMFTPGLGHYGCGWEVVKAPLGPGRAERTVIGHEGFIFWTLTRIYHIVEDDTFVALVNNTGDTPLAAIFEGISDILYGREPTEPKPFAAESVQALAFEKGAAAAIARYRELKATEPGAYVFDERGLNTLGYSLLQQGKPEGAVEVFRFVVESYPSSGNAFDSLGEGLAASGQRDEAIKAYARSVELDPTNRNAVEQLGKLTAR